MGPLLYKAKDTSIVYCGGLDINLDSVSVLHIFLYGKGELLKRWL